MIQNNQIEQPYHVCVIDIGSPKLGNLGWCLWNSINDTEFTGDDLDQLFPLLIKATKSAGVILGLEAPLFIPLRPELINATKGRQGEGRRPWSAGAGAQVLAINLPIMTYIFKHLYRLRPGIQFLLNDRGFSAKPNEIMIFEALVSGDDKGSSHIDDAQIMVSSCRQHAKSRRLPNSILEKEKHTEFLNLAAAALLRCDILLNNASLSFATPIYKPSNL